MNRKINKSTHIVQNSSLSHRMSESSSKRLRNGKLIVPSNPESDLVTLHNHYNIEKEESSNIEVIQGQGRSPSPSINQPTQRENEERFD